METVRTFFLYLPLDLGPRLGVVPLDYHFAKVAEKWDYQYRLAIVNGSGYQDPRQLGMIKCTRDTQEQAVNFLTEFAIFVPVPFKQVTPAEALAYAQAWGAPDAYLDGDGEIVLQ